MSEEPAYSEEEIEGIIEETEKVDFILANVARMVIHGGFRQNEVLNIKIRDVLDENGQLVSEIQPFLPEKTKEYTKLPIPLINPATDQARSVLVNHINKLSQSGYKIESDAPLFPDNKEGSFYTRDKFNKKFRKYFREKTISRLRKFGIKRMEELLRKKILNPYELQEGLRKFSRHSRANTTRKYTNGDVDTAGKPKKQDLLWERVVRSIERLTIIRDADVRREQTEALEKEIQMLACQADLRENLRRLLEEYKSRPTPKIQSSQSNYSGMQLSDIIKNFKVPSR